MKARCGGTLLSRCAVTGDRIAATRIWRTSPKAVPARPLRFCGVRYIDRLYAVRGSVLEEESDHFAAGIRAAWLCVRSLGAPA